VDEHRQLWNRVVPASVRVESASAGFVGVARTFQRRAGIGMSQMYVYGINSNRIPKRASDPSMELSTAAHRLSRGSASRGRSLSPIRLNRDYNRGLIFGSI
jgi:hypothetical protein